MIYTQPSCVPKYRFRQYDLWDRCTDTHPEFDQVLTIGISDPKRDWFFAHVDRCFLLFFTISLEANVKTLHLYENESQNPLSLKVNVVP